MIDTFAPFMGLVMFTGLIATATGDVWQFCFAKAKGEKSGDWSKVGRWSYAMVQGNFVHESPEQLPMVKNANTLGWLVHYIVGISYALIYLWIIRLFDLAPSFVNVVIFSLVTLAAPFFWMKPSMGMGWLGLRTAKPIISMFSTISTHLAYGLGLYLSLLLIY